MTQSRSVWALARVQAAIVFLQAVFAGGFLSGRTGLRCAHWVNASLLWLVCVALMVVADEAVVFSFNDPRRGFRTPLKRTLLHDTRRSASGEAGRGKPQSVRIWSTILSAVTQEEP
jgi:hypothetical protein